MRDATVPLHDGTPAFSLRAVPYIELMNLRAVIGGMPKLFADAGASQLAGASEQQVKDVEIEIDRRWKTVD